MRLQLIEPGLDRGDRVWPELEQADPGVGGRSLVGDHSGGEQYPQVPAHRGPRCSRRRGDLARPPRSVAQELNDVAAGGVCQRLEGRRHICNHRCNN